MSIPADFKGPFVVSHGEILDGEGRRCIRATFWLEDFCGNLPEILSFVAEAMNEKLECEEAKAKVALMCLGDSIANLT